MQRRPLFWLVISLLSLAGAFYFWQLGNKWQAEHPTAHSTTTTPIPQQTNPGAITPVPAAPKTPLQVPSQPAARKKTQTSVAAAKSRFPYRLSNTSKTVGELLRDDKAIILANALIDTGDSAKLNIPDRLRAPANSGSYVVQAAGLADDRFRALLAEANATIVCYIPNNAYLVRVSDSSAQALAGSPLTQSVLPYEPYYKLDAPLLKLAMEQTPLPPNTGLNVTVFADALDTTLNALKGIGAIVVSQDSSPFGPILHVLAAPNSLTDVAALSGVQLVSKARPRVPANDLTRTTLAVSPDSIGAANNYLGLTGNNVLVNINDSGVDGTHPDLTGRIIGDTVDNAGHGTHVAGTILGNGTESSTVTNAQGSALNANFRGMAPNAQGYSVSIFSTPDVGLLISADIDNTLGDSVFGLTSDTDLQQLPALTNAFISNNSWNYDGSSGYDISAASYDAAVRDALPGVTGPQPELFVFSAGNAGGGNDDGTGGNQDSILSPATAKNVITVGTIEQLRGITNQVMITDDSSGTNVISTNTPFMASTDSSNQVASFSSRGNVGVEIEGTFGRFKPDLVSPGTFVISDRSSTWDEKAYYNPTNFSFFTYFNQTVIPNDTNGLTLMQPGFPVPDGAIRMYITVQANKLSPNPMPPLPVYITLNDFPTTNVFDFMATNQIILPTNAITLNPGDQVFIGVADSTNQIVNFDLQVEVVYTNNVGNYFQVLSNLNDSIGKGPPFYYRYESGTSMSAAGVSGMLACMQEFFQTRQFTNSPALMKALLINGARSANTNIYGFNVSGTVNPEGWGLPSLTNTIPSQLANITAASGVVANAGTLPLLFFDQSPENALATGQSKTRVVALQPTAGVQPLRATLVWTDPPGNPAAGVKLVNNLVLIVTNLDTGDVFYGNDIPSGSIFNEAQDTNAPPNIDLVNNVQNVYLGPPLGTNYSITVMAKRVNVNAVTANTTNIVQDYALVISSGDGGTVGAPFASLTENPLLISTNLPVLTVVTDSVPLFNQRVGANPQAAPSTNGVATQWNFYIFTNTVAVSNADFTNVAFITFLPPELAVPRTGAFGEVAPPDVAATRFAGADVDLYASRDPTLTNLNPVAIAGAQKSVAQAGNEAVFFTNSFGNDVFYIGVKSESQQGGQFDIVGFASNLPFSQTDSNGNVVVTMHTLPAVIPGGSPPNPGKALLFGIATKPVQIRKVVVTDTVTCSNFSDYIGTLNFANTNVVLNNHSFFTNLSDTTETFTYDDSGEGSTPNAKTSDGPGTLNNLVGLNSSSGAFLFFMVNDSSLTDTGRVENLSLTISPQPPTNSFFHEFIAPQGWFFDFVDVPPNATNLTIAVGVPNAAPLPLGLYVRRGAFPTFTTFDKFIPLTPGSTNSLSITAFDTPPLNPGRYFYGVFNPNNVGEDVFILVTLGISIPSTAQTWLLATNVPMSIPDDAVTNSPIFVGVNEAVAQAQVGVRINHPRESDLVLTLISPHGTRVLLAENRGGLDTNGYGSGIDITNVFPQTRNGNAQAETNTLTVSTNGGISSGTLIVDYDMFTIPDDMRIYYDNVLIFDSGLVSLNGRFTINFGPGTGTNLFIVMNAPGTNPATNDTDLWNYTATVIQQKTAYSIFTDDTNKALVPIKFAVPPFGTNVTGYGTLFSDFENSLPGDYPVPGPVDGWSVVSNKVTVLTAPPQASSGSNYLSLRNGSIATSLATVAGTTYSLQFANERAVPLDPVHWWPGNSNTMDIMGITPQDGTWFPLGTDTYVPGEVGPGFNFDPSGSNYVKVVANPSLDIGAADGFTIDFWISPSNMKVPHPLIEWNDGSGLSPGLAMWISATGPGALSANLVDNSPARTNHVLSTGPGVVQTFAFQHVALTYNKMSNGLARLYYNGAVVATTNVGTNITLQTSSSFDLYFGKHLTSPDTNVRFVGQMDEIGLYNQALTDAQVQDIFAAHELGRCGTLNPPSVCPTPMANVTIGGVQAATVICGPTSTNWAPEPLSFTATGPSTQLEIDPTNNTSGVLLDSFTFTAPGQNNYLLPEEPLAKLIGERALGNWQLEIMDNRAGATNPPPQLLSWELNFTYVTATPSALPLVHGVPVTNFVAPHSTLFFSVAVPIWAQYATNILFNVTNGPLNLLFNQDFVPDTNAVNITLLPLVSSSNSTVLDTITSFPPLVPGQTYFLGVQNPGTNTASFSIEVDFDIITLTNGIPFTNSAPVNSVQYYQYTVSTNNAVATAFEILNPDGNVTLVARRGAPLPDLGPSGYDYISANPGSNNQAIVVLTNSTPVVLAPGLWYLGVFNSDTNLVNYRIRALESDGPAYPNIILLTNGVGFNFNSGPGVALTNFFEFDIPLTNTNSAALFELYNLTGNADLTLNYTNLTFTNLPYIPPFFDGSFRPGRTPEQIVIRTNLLSTNLTGSWFLGVPNNAPDVVIYTIRAVLSTNGLLISAIPINITVTPPGPGSTNGPTLTWPTVPGETYWVQETTNLMTPAFWTSIATNVAAGTTTIFMTPTNSPPVPYMFYRIVQVP